MSNKGFQRVLDEVMPVIRGMTKLYGEVEKLILDESGCLVPERLFHYTSASGLEGIITNSNLWATDYRFLNDSQELIDGKNILSAILSKTDSTIHKSLLDFINDFSDEISEISSPHIVSFCSKSDLLSQWRAYASEAEGYCVEFDTTDSTLCSCIDLTVVRGYLLPVIYDDEMKSAIIKRTVDLVELALDDSGFELNNLEDNPILKGMLTGLVYNFLTFPLIAFKHGGFSEEQEWRAVFYPDIASIKKLRKFRASSGVFVPYIETTFMQDDEERIFQRETMPIKSICLPPAAGATSKKGLELYLRGNGFHVGSNGIQIKDSTIPLRNKKAIHW